jgi:periplasmic protein TonB
MVSHPLPIIAAPPRKGPKPPKMALRAAAEADAFISALLEVPCEYKHRNPLEWIVSLAFHVVALSLLLTVPLYFTQTLDLKAFQSTWLVAPAPPPPPPPPAAPMQRIVTRSVERLMQGGKMIAPTAIPKKIAMIKEAPLPPEQEAGGVVGGVPGGIPGGQAGGVLGGIIGGTGSTAGFVAPPPPTKRIIRVGGNLKPPRQLYYVAPEYPVIAKQAHVQGTVIIDAVIDEQGNVVQAHVLSGPPLLIPSSLETVLKWRYQPSFLNGEPISVAMHVEVHFVLE